MSGTVDRFNVQIGANINELDANMRRAEARVDAAAKKMEASLKRVGSGMNVVGPGGVPIPGVSPGGGGGRRPAPSPWRVAPGSEARYAFLGGLTATMAAMAIGRALNTEPGGSSQYGEASSKMLDFIDAIGKSIPVLNEFYQAGLKMSPSSAADRDIGRFGFGSDMRTSMLNQMGLLASDPAIKAMTQRDMARQKAVADAQARLVEITSKVAVPEYRPDSKTWTNIGDVENPMWVEQFVKGNKAEYDAASKLKQDLLDMSDALTKKELEAAERLLEPAIKKTNARFGVDSFRTPLGQFRQRWNQTGPGGDNATQEGEAAKKTAANTGKLVSMIASAPVIRVFS